MMGAESSSAIRKLPDQPRVSIIIPTYNRGNSLNRCLESLTKQTYRNFDVVIVDGGSTDGTSNLVSKYSDKLFIKFILKRAGLVSKMNSGWMAASGDIVIRTDDDIVASSQWLLEIVKIFRISDGIGGVTGPTIIPEDRLEYRDIFAFLRPSKRKRGILFRLLGKIYVKIFLEGAPNTIGHIFSSGAWAPGSNFPECLTLNNPINVDTLEACNMALRRDLVERVGGFDYAYRSLSEWSEPDICFRIKKLGYRLIFNPKAIVHHMVSRGGIFVERTYAYDRMLNFAYFIFRHVRPDSFNKIVRFSLYLLFLNGYWIYNSMLSGNTDYLTGVTGTITGLVKNLPLLLNRSQKNMV